MKGLSKKEIQIISDLEFRKKYYFTRQDIEKHFDNKRQMINCIYNLHKKERIIKLNKNKYYLIPIKARTGKWAEHPFVMSDEIFNGKDYFISGWSAAHYWKLKEQIPMQVDIHTTKRQGRKIIFNIRFVFHRTTKKRIEEAATLKIGEHDFKIVSKQKAKKWIKSKE